MRGSDDAGAVCAPLRASPYQPLNSPLASAVPRAVVRAGYRIFADRQAAASPPPAIFPLTTASTTPATPTHTMLAMTIAHEAE